MKLYEIQSKGRTKYKRINGFGGCNFTPSCKENEFSSGYNLSSRNFPAISSRQIKYTLNKNCTDFYIYDDSIYTIVDGSLYKDKKAILTLNVTTADKRYFSVIGNYLVVMPDKQYYNLSTRTSGNLTASYTGTCSFGDGTRFGVAAENNRISSSGVNFASYFKPGDGISVAGSKKNNGYYVIREVSGDSLMFDENSFTEESSSASVTIERNMPNLKYTFECNNRIWGIYGNAIYASALGDPFNFNKFDGLSTDSYYKEVFSSGDFTGAISYGNSPVFFKENIIYRVFGDQPESFYIESREAPGVSYGCDMTLAKVGGMLMYAGHDGIYGYDSSYPVKLSEKLGDLRPGRGCGGSDGTRYFVSISNFKGVYDGISSLLAAINKKNAYVYNTETKTWHCFDENTAITRIECGNYGSAQDKPNVFALDSNGSIYTVGDQIAGSPGNSYFITDYEVVECEGVTGDWYFDGSARLKYCILTAQLGADSGVELEISFDHGEFVPVASINADQNGMNKSRLSFCMPRKMFSTFRVKVKGRGQVVIYNLEFHYENTGRSEK